MSSHLSTLSLSTAVAVLILSLLAFRAFQPVTQRPIERLYKYKPLKTNRSTRLFTLLPALKFDAPIQGFLDEIDLDSHPFYEGVSYLCGDLVPGHDVYIFSTRSDQTKEVACIPVYPNCLAALRVLRYRLKPRRLWVDAISIDQVPSAEKSIQVKLMTEIYENAGQVVIALKPDTKSEHGVWRAAMLIRVMGWLYRMKLLRVYDRDEQADMRMPKSTSLVVACGAYIERYSKTLGGKFSP